MYSCNSVCMYMLYVRPSVGLWYRQNKQVKVDAHQTWQSVVGAIISSSTHVPLVCASHDDVYRSRNRYPLGSTGTYNTTTHSSTYSLVHSMCMTCACVCTVCTRYVCVECVACVPHVPITRYAITLWVRRPYYSPPVPSTGTTTAQQ